MRRILIFAACLLFPVSPALAESQYCTPEILHCRKWYRQMLEAHSSTGKEGYEQAREKYRKDSPDKLCFSQRPENRPEACGQIQAGYRGHFLSPEDAVALCPAKFIPLKDCPPYKSKKLLEDLGRELRDFQHLQATEEAEKLAP